MPKDRVSLKHQGYGFVEFLTEEDADYAIRVLNMIKLFGKPIRVNKSNVNQKNMDVGANLFVGNLDPEVDEKLLYDTFSAFGVILKTPNIQRDRDTNASKGFAFVEFASFDAADACMEAMNGQFLCNRAITVNYSFKKDGKGRERHGTAAERLLASQNPMAGCAQGPNTMFADNSVGKGLTNTVPTTIQHALPPSLNNLPRFPGKVMNGNRPPNFPGASNGLPNPSRLPPPPGMPMGFGGQRMNRPPPPGMYSMTGMFRPRPPMQTIRGVSYNPDHGKTPMQNYAVGIAPPQMMVP